MTDPVAAGLDAAMKASFTVAIIKATGILPTDYILVEVFHDLIHCGPI